MVVAVPAPLVVERGHEQVRALQAFHHRPAVGVAGHGIAQGAGETVEHGCLQQEPWRRLRLPVQDLLDEVVDDEAVVPGEARDEAGGVVAASK
ncbi:MAG TPA: hypothetical protein VK453_09270 [Micromonosporaceae bacterium]|nr:hypothetical protein [Micromonosporaceae bacterium]